MVEFVDDECGKRTQLNDSDKWWCEKLMNGKKWKIKTMRNKNEIDTKWMNSWMMDVENVPNFFDNDKWCENTWEKTATNKKLELWQMRMKKEKKMDEFADDEFEERDQMNESEKWWHENCTNEKKKQENKNKDEWLKYKKNGRVCEW